MSKVNINSLQAFTIIAQEGSFTKAAGRLRVTTSALSHSMRDLEAQLGVRLLTRTTRSVTPTEAGGRLLLRLSDMFTKMEEELESIAELRDKPAGKFRITVDEYAAYSVFLPAIKPFLLEHPDIKLELFIDYGLANIVADRFDGGVRFGSIVDKDMISFPISAPMQTTIVATPDYLQKYSEPLHPNELTNHSCICLHLPTYGGIYAWEFIKDGHPLRVKVSGQLTFNTMMPMKQAALDGLGIAFLPRAMVTEEIKNGALIEMLTDWLPVFESYHFYYPSRKYMSTAFKILIEALRNSYQSRTQ